MRVLLAVEDELYGAAISQFVAAHDWQPGTMFQVVYVVEPTYVGDRITAIYGNDLQNEILRDRTEYGMHVVAQIKEELDKLLDKKHPVETKVLVASPQDAILQTAEDFKADMIVMGSHGRGGVERLLLGSISLGVLSHAKCSVVVLKTAEAAQSHKAA